MHIEMCGRNAHAMQRCCSVKTYKRQVIPDAELAVPATQWMWLDLQALCQQHQVQG